DCPEPPAVRCRYREFTVLINVHDKVVVRQAHHRAAPATGLQLEPDAVLQRLDALDSTRLESLGARVATTSDRCQDGSPPRSSISSSVRPLSSETAEAVEPSSMDSASRTPPLISSRWLA